MKNSARYFYLNFIKKEKISKDVFNFYFDRVKLGSLEKLEFLAGQYVHMYLPVKNENGRGNSRMFTISSSPLEKEYILFSIKKGKSLFKKSLFKLIFQTPVKFYGPSGNLVVDNPPAGGNKPSYIFLSMGIGITPFRSIIKYVNQKHINISITLLASFLSKEDLCFEEELINISKSDPNIKVVYVLDRITSIFNKYIKNINKHLYYIVGSPKNVIFLEEIVSRMGVSDDKIFTEDFEGY